MCVSMPGQICEVMDPENHLARVEISGQVRTVNLGLLSAEESHPGNWVLVQAGLAIQSLSPEDAQQIQAVWEEFDQLFQEELK